MIEDMSSTVLYTSGVSQRTLRWGDNNLGVNRCMNEDTNIRGKLALTAMAIIRTQIHRMINLLKDSI